MGDNLGCNDIQKRGEQTVLQNMMTINESEGRPFFLIFRWKIILHDSYQSDVIVLKIKELEQKVPGDRVKDCSRVLLSVLETPHQLYFKETALYES